VRQPERGTAAEKRARAEGIVPALTGIEEVWLSGKALSGLQNLMLQPSWGRRRSTHSRKKEVPQIVKGRLVVQTEKIRSAAGTTTMLGADTIRKVNALHRSPPSCPNPRVWREHLRTADGFHPPMSTADQVKKEVAPPAGKLPFTGTTKGCFSPNALRVLEEGKKGNHFVVSEGASCSVSAYGRERHPPDHSKKAQSAREDSLD